LTRILIAIGLNITLIAVISFVLTAVSKVLGIKTFTSTIFLGSLLALSAAFLIILVNRHRISINKH
jgi:hypothetical protein